MFTLEQLINIKQLADDKVERLRAIPIQDERWLDDQIKRWEALSTEAKTQYDSHE